MEAGFTITKQGWKLLAKLLAGDKLEITKVMVGSGKVPEGANPGEITELVQPVALATSSIPQVEDKQVSFIVEYRSDLNGGLTEGFWLNEFGVFATDPEEGEILLYYATMGDYPQYVSAYSGQAVDVRRYPVVIAMSECYNVELKPPAGAWVTFAELAETLKRRGYHSNPTLLLNGDFRKPVNRNGKSEYTGVGYTIDGWKLQRAGKIELVNDGVFLYSNTTGNVAFVVQNLNNVSMLKDKILTLSLFYELPDDMTAYLRTMSSAYSLIESLYLPKGRQCASITVQPNNSLYSVGVIVNNTTVSKPIKMIAAKLELGNQQTLAYKDADGNWQLVDPPNYDLQYALCSQYSPVTGEFVGSQHSNPNLLINAYYADKDCIVNQRGQLAYNGGYSIDMWKIGHSNVSLTILDNSIQLSASGTDNSSNVFSQVINMTQPEGQVCTLSALVKGNGVLRNLGGGNISFSTTDFELIQLLITAPEITQIQIRLLGSQSVEVKAIKLELGPVQTLAHKEGDTWVLNDPPPNKALELAKCQRYLMINKNALNSAIGIGVALSTTRLFVIIPLPTALRATPHISFNQLVAYGAGSTVASSPNITEISYINLSSNCLRCEMATSNLVAGQSYAVVLSTNDSYFVLDSNL